MLIAIDLVFDGCELEAGAVDFPCLGIWLESVSILIDQDGSAEVHRIDPCDHNPGISHGSDFIARWECFEVEITKSLSLKQRGLSEKE